MIAKETVVVFMEYHLTILPDDIKFVICKCFQFGLDRKFVVCIRVTFVLMNIPKMCTKYQKVRLLQTQDLGRQQNKCN